METLKVGDVVYEQQYGSITRRLAITRVTAKRAFARITENYELQFKLEYEQRGLREIGAGSYYNRANYYIETPELKIKAERVLLIRETEGHIKKLNPASLSNDQLRALIETIEAYSVPTP